VTLTSPARIELAHRFADELPELCRPWQAAPVPAPRLLVLNDDLADEVGLDPAWLRAPEGVDLLAGRSTPSGAQPVAMVYAGHQFGGYSPRLGDGRALLLGELTDRAGRLRDLHLKGSGQTPFARGGDGKAAIGPMLRELVIGEAMHALGVPTTRALAVVATGEDIAREAMLPGAILARLAASHLRVGTFEYAARLEDRSVVARLLDHAIARHHPAAADAEVPALAFFEAVAEAQASLVARWMSVGFIHGVMNTDNMTISGETIDYGPCAFMDRYDPQTVFSSIDHGGRYAYGNQPAIAQWNLARLAETLLPLIDDDLDRAIATATAALEAFPDRFRAHWSAEMRAKLGLADPAEDDHALFQDLLDLLHAGGVDHTNAFRSLAGYLRGDRDAARELFADGDAFDAWAERWTARVGHERRPEAVAEAMDGVNPIYIPRNHRVEEALALATAGDLSAFTELVAVVRQPFTERPGLGRYAEPAPPELGPYRTFCGT
jgi:uncharacterized protein YdiU (UPF0061 family)